MRQILIIILLFFQFIVTGNLIAQCNQGDVITFQKVFGGTGNERGHSVKQTSDGGYIVVGETTSYGAGGKDWFVMKLDANGGEQWTKTYGSSNIDDGNSISIIPTSDGGYLFVGHSGGTVQSSWDAYAVKLDFQGNILWEKKVVGNLKDAYRDVIELVSGDFILAGQTEDSNTSDDILITKISTVGTVIWSKIYIAAARDQLASIMEFPNGDLLIGCHSWSFPLGNNDQLFIRTNSLGNIIWSKYYGGSAVDVYFSTELLSDGNVIAIGETASFGVGNTDVFLSKFDGNGNVIWTRTIGGISVDVGNHVMENQNGEIIFSGYTNSVGSDYNILLGAMDFNGNLLWLKKYGGLNDEQGDLFANAMDLTQDNGIITVGGTTSFGSSGEDIYMVKTNECGSSFCNEQSVNLSITSPNITQGNAILTSNSTVSYVSVLSSVSMISFAGNYLCADTIFSPQPCNLISNFSISSICFGDSTFFTDLSMDSIGSIVNWKWYLGNGDSIVGIQNPAYFYNSSGNFNVTLAVTNNFNCVDSVVIPVTINPTFSIAQNTAICQGDSILLAGSFQNTSGVYIDLLQTVLGCDSIITTVLSINPVFTSSQSETICQGDSILFNNNFYSVTGTYADSLQTVLGCDSLLMLNLTVNSSYQINQSLAICQGDSIFLGGSFQIVSGIYIDSSQTVLGCDSLLFSTLSVDNTPIDSVSVSICQGDSLFLEGNFQNTAGVYVDSLQAVLGCDSIIYTRLIVNSIPVIIASDDSTIMACNAIQLSVTGGTTYLWSPTTGLSCTSCVNPIASPSISTTYNVKGTVNGCFSNDVVNITVDEESTLIIPNVFTPNFDGMNDGFNLVGGCVKSVDKRIYNRWGELLFESNQVEEVWNGRTTAGKEVPEGTYFYIFIVDMLDSGNEVQRIFKGTVSLFR